MIYLDHAAATPVRKEVLQAMQPYFSEVFANPSSIHTAGVAAREAVEKSREKVRKILNAASEDKIIFTSGGTESINLALQGVFSGKKGMLITSAVEHEAVLATADALQKKGCEIVFAGVDAFGRVNLKDIEKALKKVSWERKSALLSMMYTNNEVGTLQPVKEIAEIARKHKVLFHSDACQAGYEELDVQKLGVDLLTLNGSKIYGPKGVGILYVRKGVVLEPLIFGGGQEYGLRSGTENVAALVGFAKALELMQREREKENQGLKELQKILEKGLLQISESRLNGHPSERAAHIVSVSFFGIEGEQLVRHLSERGIFCSSGSACTSKKIKVSHVLQAMKIPEKFALGMVRFSFGKGNTKEEILKVVTAVREIVEVLRKC